MSEAGSRESSARTRRSAAPGAVALAAALALTFCVSGCFGPPARTGSDVRTVRIVSHEMAIGETLESIADDFYGDSGAAGYLREVNGIPESGTPDPGSVLDVPVGGEDIERYERRTEAKLHYNRGTMFADRGELGKAAEEFRAALRIDPGFADAGYNLGVVLLRSGETARAVSILRQTVAVRPEDPALLYALGAVLVDAGEKEEALSVFENVVSLAPFHEDARFSRAIVLLELGRNDEAIFHLDAYVRDFPGGKWTDRARAKLAGASAGPGEGD